MPILYFMRHGETDWNREGRLQGQTEIPLNLTGQRQAREVGAHLVDPKAAGLTRDMLANMPFLVSPMVRARQTAELMREALGLDPQAYATADDLKEIGFGRWEGKTWPEIRTLDAMGARGRERDKWGYVPPDGESYAMVRARVAQLLTTITEDCCIVAHGGIARVMLVHLAGASTAEAVGADIWQGKVLRFEKGQARWVPGPGHA